MPRPGYLEGILAAAEALGLTDDRRAEIAAWARPVAPWLVAEVLRPATAWRSTASMSCSTGCRVADLSNSALSKIPSMAAWGATTRDTTSHACVGMLRIAVQPATVSP
jgi:hypothetical protein